MRNLKILFGGFLFALFCLSTTVAGAQVTGRLPSIAFDSVNNRYLMVWEEDGGSGYRIMGKFLNPDGSDDGNPQVLSPDRPEQGCFYQGFDSDNGPVTTPSDCPNNRKPAVAYNDGKFLITWEVAGLASSPSMSPDNQYAVIFARMVDAEDLSPLPGWEEGILISKIYIAAERPGGCGTSGDFLCEDTNIQAWSQSRNPHVAGRLSGKGFVVAWETNIDFIDCYSADRRGGWSAYGRYIDENFSATSKTNPSLFSIFRDDSTIDEKCATLDNVDNANSPRVAFNSTSEDFVAVYEIARANGGRSSIGAKKITVDGDGRGMVSGSMMPDVVASVDDKSLQNPEIIPFKGDYILFAEDGDGIVAKRFTSNGIANSTPTAVDLGSGTQTNPSAMSNLGQGGMGPTNNSAPERILLSYTQSGHIFTALLDDALAVQGTAENISTGVSTENQTSVAGSNLESFLIAWQGKSDGDKVFVREVTTSGMVIPPPTPTPTPTPTATDDPPTVPDLDDEPADGATWAPTRLYLSWQAATDPDAGDSVTYNVYFEIGNDVPAGATPYKSGITDTHFIIQASTDGRSEYEPDSGITPIYLEANTDYAWKICAEDTTGLETCSGVRQFHTDDSVVGWWRFDEDPTGADCPGGQAGETVCDYSGNDNHGVPSGGSTWLPSAGDFLGRALDFDGTNDYVEVPNSPTLNPTSELTIESKHNLRSFGGVASIRLLISKLTTWDRADNTGFGAGYGNGADFNLGIGNRSISSSTSTIVNAWYHFLGTYDGTNGKIYQNGSLLNTVPVTGLINSNTQPVWIGRTLSNGGSGWYYDGGISEVILYSKALVTEEVQNSYSSQ